jgi:hypothetical protein
MSSNIFGVEGQKDQSLKLLKQGKAYCKGKAGGGHRQKLPKLQEETQSDGTTVFRGLAQSFKCDLGEVQGNCGILGKKMELELGPSS